MAHKVQIARTPHKNRYTQKSLTVPPMAQQIGPQRLRRRKNKPITANLPRGYQNSSDTPPPTPGDLSKTLVPA